MTAAKRDENYPITDVEKGCLSPDPASQNSVLVGSHHDMGGTVHEAAHLYDAVGEIWLQLFGSDVHVGEQVARRYHAP